MKKPNHRRPPLPHWDKGKGYCRWCGDATSGNRLWHPGKCLDDFFLATTSKSQRRVCFERDKGVCRCCGLDTEREKARVRETEGMLLSLRRLERRGPPFIPWHGNWNQDEDEMRAAMMVRGLRQPPGAWWQADHIKPLVEANGDITYWQADNLQTLCHWCHAKKSAADTRRRKGPIDAGQAELFRAE